MTTDLLDRWARRVADAVLPDEIDSAVTSARAYAEGGAARRRLLRRAPAAPGGSGGELVTLLPALWDALARSVEMIKAVLESPALGHGISAAALWLALRERSAVRGGRQAGDATSELTAGRRNSSGARNDPAGGDGDENGSRSSGAAGGSGGLQGPGEHAVPPELTGAARRVSERLRAHGTDPEEADRIAAGALSLLSTGPSAEVADFLGLLAGPLTPDPGTPVGRLRRLAVRAAHAVRGRRTSGRSPGPGG